MKRLSLDRIRTDITFIVLVLLAIASSQAHSANSAHGSSDDLPKEEPHSVKVLALRNQ